MAPSTQVVVNKRWVKGGTIIFFQAKKRGHLSHRIKYYAITSAFVSTWIAFPNKKPSPHTTKQSKSVACDLIFPISKLLNKHTHTHTHTHKRKFASGHPPTDKRVTAKKIPANKVKYKKERHIKRQDVDVPLIFNNIDPPWGDIIIITTTSTIDVALISCTTNDKFRHGGQGRLFSQ